jgi:hypothetical protein|tara:strand:- start:584 stop:1732 length:1149 start_codon:yes stop_codon:yes gene_type:complete
MKFSDFLKNYPEVKVANEKDSDRILDFFDKTSMKGDGLVISYERKPDFFKFLKYSSPKFIVFYAEKDDEIMCVATIIFRPGKVNGKNTHVGYLGDLRVTFDKRLALLWRRFYGDLLAHMNTFDDFYNCNYLLTAIIDENKRAVKALVNNPKLSCDYIKKSSYEMVNILMKIPFLGSKIRKDIIISRGTNENKESLRLFLEAENEHKNFGFCFNDFHNELEYRLENWDDLSMDNFIIIESKGEIIATTALWSPSKAKKIIVEQIPSNQKFLLNLLSVVTKVPKEKQELSVLYLTFLTLSEKLTQEMREEVFHDLVAYIYKNKLSKDYHLLAYTEYPNQFPLKKGLNGFIHFETPMTLYQVLDKNFLEFDLDSGFPPGFEMSLV